MLFHFVQEGYPTYYWTASIYSSVHPSIHPSLFLQLTDSLDNVMKEFIRYKRLRKLSKEEFQGSCYHMDVLPLRIFQVHMLHWPTTKTGCVWVWIKRRKANDRQIKKEEVGLVVLHGHRKQAYSNTYAHIYYSGELFGMRRQVQWVVVL